MTGTSILCEAAKRAWDGESRARAIEEHITRECLSEPISWLAIGHSEERSSEESF